MAATTSTNQGAREVYGEIAVTDSGGSLTVDGTVGVSGTVPVSAVSLPLPTGAATAALQTQPGVDIGDVTINNSTLAVTQSGTWDEVGINDSGNSITVDGTVSLTDMNAGEYETVAASQTGQVLGATGGTGDWISGVLVVPASTSPGNVLLLDNATSITVFVGGASSVSNLVPFFIPLGMKSVSGAWKLTTGANVSCIGIGNFT